LQLKQGLEVAQVNDVVVGEDELSKGWKVIADIRPNVSKHASVSDSSSNWLMLFPA
jgi:hypothetical protein